MDKAELRKVKAAANSWVSANMGACARRLSCRVVGISPGDGLWEVCLVDAPSGERVGTLTLDRDLRARSHTGKAEIDRRLLEIQAAGSSRSGLKSAVGGLVYGDGVEGSGSLDDGSVDLLLTDPPYGISAPYASESQIPRRLRRDGSDFTMPRGDFGKWDRGFDPRAWTGAVLPKVRGWAAVFCAQDQIGAYSAIFREHGFVAVGSFVWHKTNPVPFNARRKPVNAWEVVVTGKRPGTKFNGHAVHNVHTCSSPSPAERVHPTQKPLELIGMMIELFSDEGDLVFDPFAGGGTTVVAALRRNRRPLAFESDAEHYNRAVDRIWDDEGFNPLRWAVASLQNPVPGGHDLMPGLAAAKFDVSMPA